ncbi:formylglycine-generating enzyme family protein, partial [Mariniblastus sp.]|nr:formylglycine-generating enzyme family protein [Mariniblastus sp.]
DRKHQISNSELWPVVLNEKEGTGPGQRLRAACLLSKLAPDDERWQTVASDLSAIIVEMTLLESVQWLEGLTPIRDQLRPSLETAFHGTENLPRDQIDNAAALLARLYGDQPETLTHLAESATPTQLLWLLKPLETNQQAALEQLAVRLEELESSEESPQNVIARANLIIALIQLGSSDHWGNLDRKTNVSVATEIIERLGPSAGLNTVSVDYLTGQLSAWRSAASGQMAGLLLSMGQFSKSQIPQSKRKSMTPPLLDVFINHPDAEVHASARWLLQSWNEESHVEAAELKLRSAAPKPGHRWHVDLAGNTFVVFEPVDQFLVGTSDPNQERAKAQSSYIDGEQQHRRRIPRRFGICMHEVTVRQFEEFETYMVNVWRQKLATLDSEDSEDQTEAKQLKAWIADVPRRQKRRSEYSSDAPIVETTWAKSLTFCRWLSDKYSTGHCLPSVTRLQQWHHKKTDVMLLQKHIRRPGYRLPTAAEWEYACRANTSTLRPTGMVLSRLKSYAWFGGDRSFTLQSVGTLKPNGFGMFDILGNASEWCLTWFQESLPDESLAVSSDLVSSALSDPIWPDIGKSQIGWKSPSREHRGASYLDNAGDVRTSRRFHSRPFNGQGYLGFRLARTYEIEPESEGE